MTIRTLKIKLFGQVHTLHRVLAADGEVLHVAESKAEALAWIAAE